MTTIQYRGITIYHNEVCKEIHHYNPCSGHHWTVQIPQGKFYYSIGDGVRVSCLTKFKTIEKAKETIDYQLKMMEKYPEVYAQIS